MANEQIFNFRFQKKKADLRLYYPRQCAFLRFLYYNLLTSISIGLKVPVLYCTISIVYALFWVSERLKTIPDTA